MSMDEAIQNIKLIDHFERLDNDRILGCINTSGLDESQIGIFVEGITEPVPLTLGTLNVDKTRKNNLTPEQQKVLENEIQKRIKAAENEQSKQLTNSNTTVATNGKNSQALVTVDKDKIRKEVEVAFYKIPVSDARYMDAVNLGVDVANKTGAYSKISRYPGFSMYVKSILMTLFRKTITEGENLVRVGGQPYKISELNHTQMKSMMTSLLNTVTTRYNTMINCLQRKMEEQSVRDEESINNKITEGMRELRRTNTANLSAAAINLGIDPGQADNKYMGMRPNEIIDLAYKDKASGVKRSAKTFPPDSPYWSVITSPDF